MKRHPMVTAMSPKRFSSQVKAETREGNNVNEALGHKSCTDYVLTSNPERIVAFNLLDININLSDHLPLLNILSCVRSKPVTISKPRDIVFRGWDHAPLELYYKYTRIVVEPVTCKVSYFREQSAHFSDIKLSLTASIMILL
jgi:hypothetical protein